MSDHDLRKLLRAIQAITAIGFPRFPAGLDNDPLLMNALKQIAAIVDTTLVLSSAPEDISDRA